MRFENLKTESRTCREQREREDREDIEIRRIADELGGLTIRGLSVLIEVARLKHSRAWQEAWELSE